MTKTNGLKVIRGQYFVTVFHPLNYSSACTDVSLSPLHGIPPFLNHCLARRYYYLDTHEQWKKDYEASPNKAQWEDTKREEQEIINNVGNFVVVIPSLSHLF